MPIKHIMIPIKLITNPERSAFNDPNLLAIGPQISWPMTHPTRKMDMTQLNDELFI